MRYRNLLTVVASGIILSACSHLPGATDHVGADTDKEFVTVAGVRPEQRTIYRKIEIPGTIEALWNTRLFAKVPGYLETINVDHGDRVRKGQLLATLVSPEMEKELAAAVAEHHQAIAEVKRYEGQIGIAEAELNSAKAESDLSAVTLARWKALDQRLAGVVSRQQIDTLDAAKRAADARAAAAEAQRSAAVAALSAAKSRAEASKAELERLQSLGQYLKVRAPFDGIISRRFVDPGALVQSAATTQTQATPLVEIQNPSVLRVRGHVPEPDVPHVSVGRKATLTVDALPGRTFESVVDRYSFSEDPVTRTMLVEFRIDNRSGELRPGMFAHIDLALEKHESALTIPSVAVIPDKKGAYVFVAKDSKARKIRPQIGADDGINTEVLSGLTSADMVLVPGHTRLADGDIVKVTPVGQGAEKS